jgi:hypothetical protein
VPRDAHGPVRLLQPHEQIREFRNRVGIGHGIEDCDQHVAYQHAALHRVRDETEVARLESRRLDRPEQPLVHIGKQKLARHDVGRTRLAPEMARLRRDPVEQRGRQPCVDRDLQLLEILGDDRGGRPEALAKIHERDAVVSAPIGVVVDDGHGNDTGRKHVVAPAGLRVHQENRRAPVGQGTHRRHCANA